MIKEILISKPNGIGLFYQNFESEAQKDPQLMAGFFNAIQCFIQECTKDQLHAIMSGENQFCFFQGNNFSMVIKTAKNLDVKKIQDKITILKEVFHKLFEEELSRNEIDPTKYNGFEKIVRDLFKIKIETTHKSSELFEDFLGISFRKVNFKKVMDSL